MNNTTAARKSLTTVGQAVEVLRTDFTPAGYAAGLPQVWRRGVVEGVRDVDAKVASVSIRLEDGSVTAECVGPRGKMLRLVEVAA
jgi:hypothetical protein